MNKDNIVTQAKISFSIVESQNIMPKIKKKKNLDTKYVIYAKYRGI